MLPQKRKVSIALFPYVLREGKTVFGNHFSFKFLAIPNIQESKFSFVVSNKISKKATERNLLKRRGSVIIVQNNLLTTIPVAGVFFAKKGATALSYKALASEINSLLVKAHLNKRDS